MVLLLLALTHVHAGIEAGEALHDLRPCEEGDALGVAVHDIFGEVGAVVFTEVELV